MIHIYSKPNCSYCDKAKALLKSKSIPYLESEIGTDITREEAMEMFPLAKTVPVVVDDGVYIGGYQQLYEKYGVDKGFLLLQE